MASFNHCVLLGNVCADVSLGHTTESAIPVCNITLAVDDQRKDEKGQWVSTPVFVDCTLWRRTAEIAPQYLGKGSRVLIEGKLKQDVWEQDGARHSRLRVVCDELVMLGDGRRASTEKIGEENAAAEIAASVNVDDISAA